MMKYQNKEPFICCVCGKKLTKVIDMDTIDGGTITQVWANFGSKFDGDVFQVGFCDECLESLESLEEKRNIKILGNYLGFPIIKE